MELAQEGQTDEWNTKVGRNRNWTGIEVRRLTEWMWRETESDQNRFSRPSFTSLTLASATGRAGARAKQVSSHRHAASVSYRSGVRWMKRRKLKGAFGSVARSESDLRLILHGPGNRRSFSDSPGGREGTTCSRSRGREQFYTGGAGGRLSAGWPTV